MFLAQVFLKGSFLIPEYQATSAGFVALVLGTSGDFGVINFWFNIRHKGPLKRFFLVFFGKSKPMIV